MLRVVMMSLLVLTASHSAWAVFAMPSPAPVDRLIQNTQAYIDEHPDDATGYYTLGRIHYLAFSKSTDAAAGMLNNEGLPQLAPYWMDGWFGTVGHARHARAVELVRARMEVEDPASLSEEQRRAYWQAIRSKVKALEDEGWTPPSKTAEELRSHQVTARKNLSTAIEMDDGKPLFHLTLASLMNATARRLSDETIAPPEGHARADAVRQARQEAVEHYMQAFDQSVKEDLRRDSLPLPGIRAMISYEAGAAVLRLAAADDTLVPDDLHKRVEKDVSRLKEIPQRAITPIIFAIDRPHRLADLIDTDARVRFDLDGDGTIEQRSWLRPTAGLLVWDPTGRGQITSGRQLFGSVTWWMFWRTGYAAMDALDDDRDGELTGCELRGLAVWFDRDGDAVSDPGEVVPLGDLGVVGLSVRAVGQEDGSPMNPRGVRFDDGRVLPTWDWIAPAVDAR